MDRKSIPESFSENIVFLYTVIDHNCMRGFVPSDNSHRLTEVLAAQPGVSCHRDQTVRHLSSPLADIL